MNDVRQGVIAKINNTQPAVEKNVHESVEKHNYESKDGKWMFVPCE